jgi:hypothetical protein
MPRVNRRLVRTVYRAGISWHVAYWHVAYFDRTVHIYRALIGRPTNQYAKFEKKSYELGGNLLTRGMLTRGRFWTDGPRLPSRNDKLCVCRVRFVICVFPRFHVWNPVFFVSRKSKCFFICLSRPQDCSDCDLELQTVSLAELLRGTPGEVPTGVGRTATYDKCPGLGVEVETGLRLTIDYFFDLRLTVDSYFEYQLTVDWHFELRTNFRQ